MDLRITGVIRPDAKNWWMSNHVGASCVLGFDEQSELSFDVVVLAGGRGVDGRSRLGIIKLKLDKFDFNLLSYEISDNPIIELGERGAFDEAGMSYPWYFKTDDNEFIFYTGWKLNQSTGFENNLGVLKKVKGRWIRSSRAPILPLSNDEPFGTGSVAVYHIEDKFHLLYTSFLSWNSNNSDGHEYGIKHATSSDLVYWDRKVDFLIPPSQSYHAVCRPSLVGSNILFSARGPKYNLMSLPLTGTDISLDSLDVRNAYKVNVDSQGIGGFDKSVEYSYPFNLNGQYLCLFNGNGYGESGLGIGVLDQ